MREGRKDEEKEREERLRGEKECSKGERREGNNTELLFFRDEITYALRDHICASFLSLFSVFLLVMLKEGDENCLPQLSHYP